MASNKLKGSNLMWIGGAAIVGAAAAMLLSGTSLGDVKNAAGKKINSIVSANPASAKVMGQMTGNRPVYSRGFPDQSIKFNSIPSPMVEPLVPFDSSGRYAQVTGPYDGCDSRLF